MIARIFKLFDMPACGSDQSALSSLQIPMLGGQLDPSFFTNEAHPARQLFDRMARAVMGLPQDDIETSGLLAGFDRCSPCSQ
ncbi:MAG: DUF1631 family protein [Dechloromonas sp.]|uniref:DUF1631 family protein n=1 Tax=Candidatus Dechloromonas phosphorivorans TaxID=2899244 RepID=A0A935N2D8_9RHOO|nr:DUF1631 family protein [Candidatus Dechloromonas phosphorivorans]